MRLGLSRWRSALKSCSRTAELSGLQVKEFEDHFFWLGVYDPPVKILDRKNEILFYGKHVDEQAAPEQVGAFSKLLCILFRS